MSAWKQGDRNSSEQLRFIGSNVCKTENRHSDLVEIIIFNSSNDRSNSSQMKTEYLGKGNLQKALLIGLGI